MTSRIGNQIGDMELRPPSMNITWPVIDAAPSLARKVAAAPISSNVAVRPSGDLKIESFFICTKLRIPRPAKVFTGPGLKQFTRIPQLGPNSKASPRETASSEAFAQPITL